MNYLFVGFGGIFGALTRYYAGVYISEIEPSLFPFGTLFINLAGSFLLSFIAYSSLLKWNLNHRYLLAINTGYIGAFTTFSTFSVETNSLLINSHYALALIYVLVSLIGGLCLSWLGIYLTHVVHKKGENAA